MTNQPYQGYDGYDGRREGHEGHEGHEGYDPYGRPRHRHQRPEDQVQQGQAQAWPGGQQAYDDPHAAQQYTQQWQGQTWETRMQPPVPPTAAEETSYLPPQTGQVPQSPAAPQAQQAPPGHPGYAGRGDGGMPSGPAVYAGYGVASTHGTPIGASAPPAAPPVPDASPPPAHPTSTPAPGAPGGPGYGPATLAGNTRVTDAQRARAEGRSPVIEPGMQPAALTALLGLLLAGGAALGTYALLVPLVALQGLTAAGWFRLNGMWPARQGIALGFLGALVADVALLASDRSPTALLGTLGVWVLLSLVLQLRSHADPDERMYGLTATVTAAALAIVASGHLAADADAVTVGGAAVAAAVVARALPLPTPASVVAALLVAAGAGALVGGMTGFGASGALVGAGTAVCALIGHRAASYDYPSRFVHFTAGVALPLAAAAPAVYVLGRLAG
ncbi:hypothetical protein [Streptomyces sp. KMM 9044]|uniref:hypothetical protein n=1 Tax=Streptomyces sp. KMM 9044 TaxID=2744474 RepID=UPI00215127F4|nr:hypothetical protein [Streptomyces sp. KMM 9044]WAX79300.1 hypothetical protein HUV60_018160 [Streptomyces sp. KMM 9044]